MALINCPECKKEISDTANKCPICGYVIRPARKWSPGVAAVLSLVIPGAGQLYQGRVLAGLLWFVIVILGYVILIIPGLILHLACIISAAMTNPYPKA
jgi:TM2 domain-containing membrane protein YozV